MKSSAIKNFMLKVLRLIILIVAITLFVGGINKIVQAYHMNKYVEPYCAVKYSNNVSEYKACKQQDTTGLIKSITNELQNGSAAKAQEVPDLPLLY